MDFTEYDQIDDFELNEISGGRSRESNAPGFLLPRPRPGDCRSSGQPELKPFVDAVPRNRQKVVWTVRSIWPAGSASWPRDAAPIPLCAVRNIVCGKSNYQPQFDSISTFRLALLQPAVGLHAVLALRRHRRPQNAVFVDDPIWTWKMEPFFDVAIA